MGNEFLPAVSLSHGVYQISSTEHGVLLMFCLNNRISDVSRVKLCMLSHNGGDPWEGAVQFLLGDVIVLGRARLILRLVCLHMGASP